MKVSELIQSEKVLNFLNHLPAYLRVFKLVPLESSGRLFITCVASSSGVYVCNLQEFAESYGVDSVHCYVLHNELQVEFCFRLAEES